MDNVEGEWGAFNEIMKRKDAAIQLQVGSLQMMIVAEDKVVEQKTPELLQEWEKGKPVQVLTLTVHLHVLQGRRTLCERREEKGMKDWEKEVQLNI